MEALRKERLVEDKLMYLRAQWISNCNVHAIQGLLGSKYSAPIAVLDHRNVYSSAGDVRCRNLNDDMDVVYNSVFSLCLRRSQHRRHIYATYPPRTPAASRGGRCT
jgi:hypothetical protein